jgi:hypothetical protein
MVLGELNEPAVQFLLVVGGWWHLEVLGGAVLTHDPTRPPLFHPERFLEHEDCSTAGVRG